jgi:PAS domain S-box-containing protein
LGAWPGKISFQQTPTQETVTTSRSSAWSDGIWIIAANAITLYANSRMAEILGTTVDDLIGQPSFDYVFPEDLGAAQELFDRKKNGR